MHGRPRGWRAHRHRERGGGSDDAVGRGVHGVRRAPRRHDREAPGGDQPAEHGLLDQAVHGAQGERGRRGGVDRPLQGRLRTQRRRARRDRRAGVLAPGDQRDDPPEAEGRRRGLSRRHRRLGGDHGPGVLQRRPAPGDQGRRPDRRPRRQAHHQRADRGLAGLRARQGDRPDDPRLRPRRRHLRRVGARDRRRRVRGQVDRRRQPPRRRQLRQGDRRLAGRRVQARPGHRPAGGPDGAPAALRGRREGEDRALDDAGVADQPAVRDGRPERPQAPRHAPHAREARRADEQPARPRRRPGPPGARTTPRTRAPTRSTTSCWSAA